MKLPGEASLAFEIEAAEDGVGRCRLVQTARYKPRGLLGLAYWYGVLPLHGYVFRGMLEGIKRAAEELALGDGPASGAASEAARVSAAGESE
jgi:hypothetical protein